MPNRDRIEKPARKPHRKSRNGCINCKRRRVKCDESRPHCARCVVFGLRCKFAGDAGDSESCGSDSLSAAPDHESYRPRRRGRPRKDWSVDPSGTPAAGERIPYPPASVATPEPATHTSTATTITEKGLSVDEAELLLHFAQVTACSLVGDTTPDDPMLRFWSYNLPRIGLSYRFVLHLAYALAAYHMAHHEAANGPRESRYRYMAEHYSSSGLRQLTPILARIDGDNGGAAYIAATMVCYCTFAAGPTGPGDLLLCNLDTTHDAGWLPLIYGVRLIREKLDADVLFSGLMEPFLGGNRAQSPPPPPTTTTTEARRARCHREGFERLDWEEPLRGLRGLVASRTSDDGTETCLREVDGLRSIYEATYGDRDANYDGPPENQFVFAWLYRAEKAFIARLRQRDPVALVVLAYYAVLLRTSENLWYMKGWAGHLLEAVRGLVEDDGYASWLRWPTESLRRK